MSKLLYSHVDPFTGEVFSSPLEHHYEVVDSVPFAPPITAPRLSLRERVERLLMSGAQLPPDEGDEDDYNFGDDEEEPLTAAERALIATERVREEAARRRATPPPSPVQTPPRAPDADPAGVSSPPPAAPDPASAGQPSPNHST